MHGDRTNPKGLQRLTPHDPWDAVVDTPTFGYTGPDGAPTKWALEEPGAGGPG
ncbi:hypothetical protein [Streptomyces milbemycinicus]|uniref:Uncharacterized protein n=1 Tax=Streptomyces milbemycinicus TaxID=476552 RepID=A0ABW8LHN6_9ACTN